MKRKYLEKKNSDQLDSPKVENEEQFFGQKKFRTMAGLLTIFFLLFSFATDTTLSEEEAMVEIKNRTSSSIEAGYQLDIQTDVELEPRDFEVTGFDGNGTARMLIWDFQGDSNNEIQILANGEIVREVHVLNDNVVAYSVPVPSVVTITGLYSSSGTIPYAVKFPDRKETIFNAVLTGGANQYNLIPRY